ncbi:MAG: hypothetical protein U1F43_11645 [Myxococcota bacterium]
MPQPALRTSPAPAWLALALSLGLGACGRGDGPPAATVAGLEAAHARAFATTTGTAAMLDEVATLRRSVVAALKATGVELDRTGAAPIDLGSVAGWEAMGLDPEGDLTVVIDDRLGGAESLVPIVLVRLSDREKLAAALGKLPAPARLGPDDGGIAPITVDDAMVGYLGALGERSALALTLGADAKATREGFAAFLAGGGEALDASDRFRGALQHGPGGPVLSLWLGGVRPLLALGREVGFSKAQRAALANAFAETTSSLGLQLGREGLTLRLAPTAASRPRFERATAALGPSPDFASLIPPTGWAAMRAGLDLATLPSQLEPVTGVPPAELERALAHAGSSWDAVRAALSGQVGFAVDLETLAASLAGDATRPGWLAMLGVADGDKLDALLAQVGRAADRLVHLGDLTLAYARVDDMLVVAPDVAALDAALARRHGESLADTEAGKVLGETIALSAAADLSPLVAWVERQQDPSANAWALVPLLPGWPAFRAAPIVTLRAGYDGAWSFAELCDSGLAYGALQLLTVAASTFLPHQLQLDRERALKAALAARAVAEAEAARAEAKPAYPTTPPPTPLPEPCRRFLGAYSACIDKMDDSVRAPARANLRQMFEAWAKAPTSEVEPSCTALLARAADAYGASCPTVKWDGSAPSYDPGALPPSCRKFIDTYSRCIDALPEATRAPAKQGLRQIEDAWAQVPGEVLDSACGQAFDALKTSLGSICPNVKFE